MIRGIPLSKAVPRPGNTSVRRIGQLPNTARMEILIRGRRLLQPRTIPFLRRVEKANRVLDQATQNEWMDDAERRLRVVISQINPRPAIRGYSVERSRDGLSLCTVTAQRIGKREMGLLCAGDWPCWAEIVKAVPEFHGVEVVFDAVSRFEWSRRWDMRLQHSRICLEYGIYA